MSRSTVAVRFTGDAADLKRSIGDVEGRLGGIGSKIAGFGKVVAAGLAGVAVGAGALAKSAIDAGSDLNETISKSNTVFGDAAGAIDAWSRTAASSFGQSRKQALDAASSFGNMFSQLGIGDQQAADMSKSMTELASDFASFHNADISEVLEAQQAAFRGEYDAVQKFVPTINAAAVEQKALAMGLGETTKDLDAQDKALATQALLMEGAGDAAGDFARTSDGLANKQRIMSARFEDVKAKIGQGLIPVVTKLAEFVTAKVIPAFEKWGPKVSETVASIAAVVQEHWPRIQEIITKAIEQIRAVVEGVLSVITTLWDNFGNNILEFVQRVWPDIQNVIESVMEIIRSVIQTVTALIQGDWQGVWEGLKAWSEAFMDAFKAIFAVAFEAIRSAIGVVLEIIGSIFKSAWEGITDIARSAVAGVVDVFLGMAETIVGAAASAFSWVPGLGDKLDEAKRAIEKFRDDVNAALSGVKDKEVKINFVRSDFIGPLPKGVQRLPAGFIGPVPEAHDGGHVTANGIEPLRSDEVLTKLQVGETVYPKGAGAGGAGIQIGQVVMQAATPAQLRQELEFMLAARGI